MSIDDLVKGHRVPQKELAALRAERDELQRRLGTARDEAIGIAEQVCNRIAQQYGRLREANSANIAKECATAIRALKGQRS